MSFVKAARAEYEEVMKQLKALEKQANVLNKFLAAFENNDYPKNGDILASITDLLQKAGHPIPTEAIARELIKQGYLPTGGGSFVKQLKEALHKEKTLVALRGRGWTIKPVSMMQ